MLLHEARTLLGIDQNVSARELRTRYRTLVKQLHPDGGSGDGRRLSAVLDAYRTVRAQIGVEESTQAPPPQRAEAPVRRSRRTRPRRASVPEIRNDPRLLFTYGRWATGSPDPAVRRIAVRRLAESGLTAVQVFLKQALFDGDSAVAIEAAVGLTVIGSSRSEHTILSLFDQLSREQRCAIVDSVASRSTMYYRLLAYAEADPYPEVRMRAMEILQTVGER